MTKQEFIKTISEIKKFSVIFSQATRMPMVFCAEETADDFVFIYLNEEDASEKAKALTGDKQPAFVVNCKENEVLPFLAELRLTGVNAICFVTAKADGAEEFVVQLTEFLRFPDMSAIPEIQRPVENPTLQLSMLYFMQEVRRPVEQAEKKNLDSLEEETSANLAKSRFLIPVQDVAVENEEKNKRAIMLLKNDNGDMFFPLFTDGAELRKFMREQRHPIIVGDFKAVIDLMKKGNATGLVLNPASSNVILNKLGVLSVEKRFLQQ